MKHLFADFDSLSFVVGFAVMVAVMFCLMVLGGCVTMPNGPSVLVYPTPGKSLELFQQDEESCRRYARMQGEESPQEGAALSAVKTAAFGTVLGTVAGTVIGVAAGNPGAGAAIGAGSGLVLGSAGGAQAGMTTGQTLQQRYDHAYLQCHYSRGNQVPGMQGVVR
jgi:hypothetical protein